MDIFDKLMQPGEDIDVMRQRGTLATDGLDSSPGRDFGVAAAEIRQPSKELASKVMALPGEQPLDDTMKFGDDKSDTTFSSTMEEVMYESIIQRRKQTEERFIVPGGDQTDLKELEESPTNIKSEIPFKAVEEETGKCESEKLLDRHMMFLTSYESDFSLTDHYDRMEEDTSLIRTKGSERKAWSSFADLFEATQPPHPRLLRLRLWNSWPFLNQPEVEKVFQRGLRMCIKEGCLHYLAIKRTELRTKGSFVPEPTRMQDVKEIDKDIQQYVSGGHDIEVEGLASFLQKMEFKILKVDFTDNLKEQLISIYATTFPALDEEIKDAEHRT